MRLDESDVLNARILIVDDQGANVSLIQQLLDGRCRPARRDRSDWCPRPAGDRCAGRSFDFEHLHHRSGHGRRHHRAQLSLGKEILHGWPARFVRGGIQKMTSNASAAIEAEAACAVPATRIRLSRCSSLPGSRLKPTGSFSAARISGPRAKSSRSCAAPARSPVRSRIFARCSTARLLPSAAACV